MALKRLLRVTVLDSICVFEERTLASCDWKKSRDEDQQPPCKRQLAVFLSTAPAVSHQTAVGVDSLSSARGLVFCFSACFERLHDGDDCPLRTTRQRFTV